jgi:hypothetical protein
MKTFKSALSTSVYVYKHQSALWAATVKQGEVFVILGVFMDEEKALTYAQTKYEQLNPKKSNSTWMTQSPGARRLSEQVEEWEEFEGHKFGLQEIYHVLYTVSGEPLMEIGIPDSVIRSES